LKERDLNELSDEDLIKAHLQAAKCDEEKFVLTSTDAGRLIEEADPDRRANLAAAGVALLIQDHYREAGRISSILLRARQKDWTAPLVGKVVTAAAALNRSSKLFVGFSDFPYKPLITAVEKTAEREGVSSELREALEYWKAALLPRDLTPAEEIELGTAERITTQDVAEMPWSKMSDAYQTIERLQRIRIPLTEERKLIERISRVLSIVEKSGKAAAAPIARIDSSDAVGAKIAADVGRGGRATGADWARLLNHARTLASTKPSPKWLEEAAQLVRALDSKSFADCISEWFNEAGKPAAEKLMSYREVMDATLFTVCTIEILKGLVWVVVAANRVALAPAMGNLAEACFKKVPNIGPRNVKVANAAVAALSALEKPEAVTHLSRLRLRVRHPSSRTTIDKALAAVSKKTGISPEDLAEMSVPAFGLNKQGKRKFQVGNFHGELVVMDSRTVALHWSDAHSAQSSSPPPEVRKNFGDQLKRLQREARDTSIMLAAQALQLERCYLNNRNWDFATWRELFLDHPLIGSLSRRLIWQIEDQAVMSHEGGFVTAKERTIKPAKNANISLWHPIHAALKEVVAWREWLESHEITQPFKQAHREIYVLSDAEKKTGTYSNRFAGHILRQHQFAAICSQRGWDYRLQGDFDSHSTPTLRLPTHALTAEFWVESIRRGMTQRGIFLYLSSDQVRFGREVSDVPEVVFSEVMRDVDLFVGVTSVMNDPTWRDHGPEDHRDYWEQWSFGELTENGKSRREVLERLLPRVARSAQFELKDRFLVVKGNLRTYKIHLGSANILMEPNDQYLCIVADHGRDAPKLLHRVFLPFEGDTTLSLILSKALLLAEDNKIKDKTILRQIQA